MTYFRRFGVEEPPSLKKQNSHKKVYLYRRMRPKATTQTTKKNYWYID